MVNLNYIKPDPLEQPQFSEGNLLSEGWRWWMIPLIIGVVVILISIL